MHPQYRAAHIQLFRESIEQHRANIAELEAFTAEGAIDIDLPYSVEQAIAEAIGSRLTSIDKLTAAIAELEAQQ